MGARIITFIIIVVIVVVVVHPKGGNSYRNTNDLMVKSEMWGSRANGLKLNRGQSGQLHDNDICNFWNVCVSVCLPVHEEGTVTDAN